MTDTLLIGCDGSDSAKRALELAATQAKVSHAKVIVAHIIEWSPYTFLTQEEIAERHKRRQEEMTRAEAHITAPIVATLTQQGIQAEGIIQYGNIAKSLCAISKDKQVKQIFIGRTGEDSISDRLFGTVSNTLAQVSPVPVTVVP